MTMFLVGSGPADSLDSVHDRFVAAAKKRGTRVAVALLGAEGEVGSLLADYVAPIQARWPEVEVVPIWLDDEPEQNTTAWPDDFEQVAALVVAGGWTPGYLEALRPRRDLIAKLVRRGTPYLGYSAGAMVVGKRAIVGGTRFRGRQMVPEVWGEGLDELELRAGLALIGPSVDVHADVSSLGRALAALEKGEVATVVAIDEGTCLVVDPVSGRTTVEGSQRIHWLQRDGKGYAITHDSSAAEVERHAGFRAAEQAAAEALAQQQRETEELAQQQREAEEQQRRQDEEEVAAGLVAGTTEPELVEAPATDRSDPPTPVAAASQDIDPQPTADPQRTCVVEAAERAANQAAALEGEPVPDEYGQLHAEPLSPDSEDTPRA